MAGATLTLAVDWLIQTPVLYKDIQLANSSLHLDTVMMYLIGQKLWTKLRVHKKRQPTNSSDME